MDISTLDIVDASPGPVAEMDRLGNEIAELSAHIEAAGAYLLELIREFDARGGWANGFHSCAQWLSWRVGMNRGAALTELMQTSFRHRDLQWAIEIAEALLARFEDKSGGGFFFTSHDHEALIHRPKSGHDNATPSGNGIAAQSLVTLGHWLGEPRYLDAGRRTVRAFAQDVVPDAESGV